MIDPATQAEILRLHFSEKKSGRAIAQELHLHRRTVAALIQRRSVITERSDESKRSSILTPFFGRIEELLKKDPGRSSVNILQALRLAGYLGGLTILKDHLRTCRPVSEPKAFLSLEFLPGQAAQVDWGEFGDVFGIGRKVHGFVMVLCWSRQIYLEFTFSANFESFIRCHEHALAFFQGVPSEIWYDNLATAVAERQGRLTRFNPRFFVYTGHHNFRPIACNVASGWEKGRVEDGVKFIRDNFWPGREFVDLSDMNVQARTWMQTFANKRTHETTHKIPELQWEQERPNLQGLREPFDTDEVKTLPVSPQWRIAFDSNHYTVPWTLAGRMVTLRANGTEVSIWYGNKQVASHQRCWKRNETVKNPRHEEGLRERKAGAHPDSEIAAIKSIGPNASRYLDLIPAQTRSIRSELNHLLVLITVYGAKAVEETMGRALSSAVVGSVHLERWLSQADQPVKKQAPLSLTDPRLNLPPITPDLRSYDRLLMEKEEEEKNTPEDNSGGNT